MFKKAVFGIALVLVFVSSSFALNFPTEIPRGDTEFERIRLLNKIEFHLTMILSGLSSTQEAVFSDSDSKNTLKYFDDSYTSFIFEYKDGNRAFLELAEFISCAKNLKIGPMQIGKDIKTFYQFFGYSHDTNIFHHLKTEKFEAVAIPEESGRFFVVYFDENEKITAFSFTKSKFKYFTKSSLADVKAQLKNIDQKNKEFRYDVLDIMTLFRLIQSGY